MVVVEAEEAAAEGASFGLWCRGTRPSPHSTPDARPRHDTQRFERLWHSRFGGRRIFSGCHIIMVSYWRANRYADGCDARHCLCARVIR